MPTHEELMEAMDAVVRLYDMRETYARAKSELEGLEREMDRLQKKVWNTLYRVQTREAAETPTKGGAK